MEFRPCIDIHQGKVKQIIGSSLNSSKSEAEENFVAEKSAEYFASLYKEDGLAGGHVIMLDDSQQTKQEAIKALKAYPDGLQIGGGITDQSAPEFIRAGASQVIVSSFIFVDGRLSESRLTGLKKAIGKDRLVLDLSCRYRGDEYVVVIDRWQTFTDYAVTVENLKALSRYCAEFLVHGVDSEGKRQGIEEDLLATLSEFTDIPVTYAGGVRSLTDVEQIRQVGQDKVNFTVGSSLDIFGGDLDYREVINYLKQ
ncbi:phosphoribosylformimino-5-aminoimidazole carboxamide ribotide isomerase [Patescibacteria group bacterium]|nr:phosphoribosylformimino-5-aminoimidazole carboxamide ribotide isomerase [Patescibacteria group bacterium]